MYTTRNRSLLDAMAVALLFGALSGCGDKAVVPDKPDDGIVISVERDGGRATTGDPFKVYRFTVTKDGSWEFTPVVTGKPKKGKMGENDVAKWVKEIEDGGFGKLVSHPTLGQADGSFMDITLKTAGGKEQKRIVLVEKVSKAIDQKIHEIVESVK